MKKFVVLALMDASIAPNNPSSHADSVGTGTSARTATSTVRTSVCELMRTCTWAGCQRWRWRKPQ